MWIKSPYLVVLASTSGPGLHIRAQSVPSYLICRYGSNTIWDSEKPWKTKRITIYEGFYQSLLILVPNINYELLAVTNLWQPYLRYTQPHLGHTRLTTLRSKTDSKSQKSDCVYCYSKELGHFTMHLLYTYITCASSLSLQMVERESNSVARWSKFSDEYRRAHGTWASWTTSARAIP